VRACVGSTDREEKQGEVGEKEKESACVGVCLSNKLGLGVGEVGSEVSSTDFFRLKSEEGGK
jgi:hypothetical protein